MATATDNRLEALRQRIEQLEEKAQASAAEARSQMRRYVETLKEDEESARAAARARAAAGEARLEQLATELEIAEQRLAAEVAETETEAGDAVAAALEAWDAYLERRLTSLSIASAAMRERGEEAIADLRQRRLAVAESLAGIRAGTGAAWREARSRATAGLDELKRRADAAFRIRGEDGR